MPSLEGFKTWFDYQLLIYGVAIGIVVLLVAGRIALELVGNLPLTPAELVFVLLGVSVAVILGSVW